MNKKSYINHYLTLFKVTTLLFTLSSNPVWANIKTAQGTTSGFPLLTRTFTFNGNLQLNVSALQPAYIVFSQARDNLDTVHIQSSEINAPTNSLAPFNNWINTKSAVELGYSFVGITCTSNPCPTMKLPLLFHPDLTNLTPTGKKNSDGGEIFKLHNESNLGVSFQIGVKTNTSLDWVNAKNNFSSLKVLMVPFNSSDKISLHLRAKFHLLTDFSSLNNDITIEPMNTSIGKIKLETWRGSTGNFSVKYVVEDKGDISIFFKTPKIILKKQQRRCTLNNAPVSPNPVKLRAVKKRELEAQSEMEGGTFQLRVNCDNTTYNKANGKWLFPVVKVTFTDEDGTTNNGTNDLLRTQTGSGQATGVSLRIKRENGTETVKYGADSAQMGNAGQFELRKQPSPAGGDQYAEETFKVYYVKDLKRGDLTEGKVNAAATFTMSYQ
ncbi:fimbrial protein [Haemophilus influenzae]|uniref:fimbrial protein n=1 Tax=Haemophilus influenzae TaxID=727 RepID=UPI000DD4DC9D|nr:fimbrial protein [Haemophilus influenzae]